MKEKPKTQNELAILYQVTQPTISKIKKKGYDIQDRDDFRRGMLAQNKRPPAWVNGCPWDDKPEKDPSTDINIEDLDMEQLRKDLMNAADYDDARFIKTKIEGLKAFLQLSILERNHLPKDEVISDMRRLSAGVSSGLDGLALELPAVCEGLTAPQMKGKIKPKTEAIKYKLSDGTSEIYNRNGWD